MFYERRKEKFSDLFGNCVPVVINEYEDVVQVKYNLGEMDSQIIYEGFSRLKKRYQGKYRVKVLFVYPGILQIILGTEEAVSRIENEDFMIEVC